MRLSRENLETLVSNGAITESNMEVLNQLGERVDVCINQSKDGLWVDVFDKETDETTFMARPVGDGTYDVVDMRGDSSEEISSEDGLEMAVLELLRTVV